MGALLTPVERYLRACGLSKTATALRAERKLRAHRDLVAASEACGNGGAGEGDDADASTALALVEAFGPRPRPRLYSKVRREKSRKTVFFYFFCVCVEGEKKCNNRAAPWSHPDLA